jgi:hypothetical protein
MSDIGIKIVIILSAIAVAIGVKFIPNTQDKQVVEQAAQEVIKEETGI